MKRSMDVAMEKFYHTTLIGIRTGRGTMFWWNDWLATSIADHPFGKYNLLYPIEIRLEQTDGLQFVDVDTPKLLLQQESNVVAP